MVDDLPDAVRQKLDAIRERFAGQLGERLRELGEQAERYAQESEPAVLQDLHQRLHSLAGACGMFGFAAIGVAARESEVIARALLDGADALAARQRADFLARLRALALADLTADPTPSAQAARLPAGPGLGRDPEQPVRVLVIEDDPTLAEELVTALAQFGYDAQTSACLPAAGKTMGAALADVLVLDFQCQAGQRNGAELLQAWRAEGRELPPVLFISGRSDFEARMLAARAGGAAYLTKPVDVPLLAECIEELLPKREESPARVLVIDDDPLLTEHYRLVLEAAGMAVQTLNRPETVLEVLASFRPEVILLDLNMPGYSGQDLARMIRQQPEWVGIAITYLSGETSLDKQIAALGEAADDFLNKPISDRQLVAAVAARARRARELSKLAAKDSLTGLLKHSAIKEALVQECSRLARNAARPVSVAMVDIDHFKRVNDTYGHAAGDRVIKALAHLLRQRLRATDRIGRYGGEEFLVVMPDCGRASAHDLLDDIRMRFSTLLFPNSDGTFSCRLSAGVASSEQVVDPASLLNAADEALYQAKRDGRDRVCDAPETPKADSGD